MEAIEWREEPIFMYKTDEAICAGEFEVNEDKEKAIKKHGRRCTLMPPGILVQQVLFLVSYGPHASHPRAAVKACIVDIFFRFGKLKCDRGGKKQSIINCEIANYSENKHSNLRVSKLSIFQIQNTHLWLFGLSTSSQCFSVTISG